MISMNLQLRYMDRETDNFVQNLSHCLFDLPFP